VNTILDVLLLRRPKIDYISPPICEVIFSGTSHPVIVLEPIFKRKGPTGLRSGGVGHFQLTWEISPGALCYSVYKATTPDPFGPYELVSECSPDNTFDATPTGPGCYRVSVITEDGESDLSDPLCDVGEDTAPEVVTDPASAIFTTTAVLNGHVSSIGSPTFAGFEWGLTISYGNTTPMQSMGSNITNDPFSESRVGLSGGTTYHFRAIANNDSGPAVGLDRTFTTLSPPPVPNIDVVELSPINHLSENGVAAGVFH
jgi:hypothetical protein